jgi:hypothetical protein
MARRRAAGEEPQERRPTVPIAGIDLGTGVEESPDASAASTMPGPSPSAHRPLLPSVGQSMTPPSAITTSATAWQGQVKLPPWPCRNTTPNRGRSGSPINASKLRAVCGTEWEAAKIDGCSPTRSCIRA